MHRNYKNEYLPHDLKPSNRRMVASGIKRSGRQSHGCMKVCCTVRQHVINSSACLLVMVFNSCWSAACWPYVVLDMLLVCGGFRQFRCTRAAKESDMANTDRSIALDTSQHICRDSCRRHSASGPQKGLICTLDTVQPVILVHGSWKKIRDTGRIDCWLFAWAFQECVLIYSFTLWFLPFTLL